MPPPSGLDTTNEPLRVEVLDNLGEEVASYEYTGDGITPTYTNGVPGLPAGDGVDLREFSMAALDDQGQTFESQMFTVDQTTGAIGAALTSKNFENRRGQTVMAIDPNGTVTKNSYDGAGRVLVSYVTDGGVTNGMPDGWSDTPNLANDIVLSQTEYAYDADNNVILTTTRDRLPGDGNATGALGDASGIGSPAARFLRRLILRSG